MYGLSVQALSHFKHPYHSGNVQDPDMVGCCGTPGHGPFCVIYLKLSGRTITEAHFQTFGCAAAIASGSAVAKLVEGMGVEKAGGLTEGAVNLELGGLPEGKLYCISLALGALRNALRQEGSSHGSKAVNKQ